MTTKPPDWWTDALVKVAYGIRRNTAAKVDESTAWDAPGIKAAIIRVAEAGTSPVDTAKVVIAGADNPKMKTPGAIVEPGPQWSGTAHASSKQKPRCPKHDVILQAGDCPKCVEGLTRNRPANFQAIYERARAKAQQQREEEIQEAIQP